MRRDQDRAIVDELDALLDGLTLARREAADLAADLEANPPENKDKAEALRIINRQLAATASLRCVITFLLSEPVFARRPEVIELGLENPLRDVQRSLFALLHSDRPPELFRRNPFAKSRRSPTEAALHAKAAAAVDVLHLAGDELDDACDEIAKELNAIGYRKTRSGGTHDFKITGTTVKKWREEARAGGGVDYIGRFYRDIMEQVKRWQANGISPSKCLRILLTGMAQELTDGHLRSTPVPERRR